MCSDTPPPKIRTCRIVRSYYDHEPLNLSSALVDKISISIDQKNAMQLIKAYRKVFKAVSIGQHFIGVAVLSDQTILEFVPDGVRLTYPDGTRHFIHNNNFDKNGNRIYEQ